MPERPNPGTTGPSMPPSSTATTGLVAPTAARVDVRRGRVDVVVDRRSVDDEDSVDLLVVEGRLDRGS